MEKEKGKCLPTPGKFALCVQLPCEYEHEHLKTKTIIISHVAIFFISFGFTITNKDISFFNIHSIIISISNIMISNEIVTSTKFKNVVGFITSYIYCWHHS